MGNNLSLDNSYGNIIVQTTRNIYTADEQVDGFVHLNLLRDFPSNVLHLVIQGEEKVKFVSVTQERDPEKKLQPLSTMNNGNLGNTMQPLSTMDRRDLDIRMQPLSTRIKRNSDNMLRQVVNVHKDKNEFFNHTFPLYSTNGGNFSKGQYSFPFSFKLSSNLPGSFCKKWEEHDTKCYAKVNYKIWAGLKDDRRNKSLHCKLPLRVNQKYEQSKTNQNRSFRKQIKAYCYTDIGEFDLGCIFQNDSYRVNDTANVLISVDNSKAKVDVKSIECTLWQKTFVKISGGKETQMLTESLSHVSLPGVPAGDIKAGNDSLPLMLPIRTASELEATCNGTLIKNTFSLEVKTVLDACLCCENHPNNQLDVKISNAPYNPMQELQVPNWTPQVMNPYVCTITPEYRMTKDFMDNLQINPNQEYPTL